MRGDSESSRTGGVLLYIKEGIRFDIIGIERYERNWWTITIKIKDKDYKGIIMIAYHSPNGRDGDFINFLEEIWKKKKTCINAMQNDDVIIMGDFNVDMSVNNCIRNRLVRIMDSLRL